MRSQRTLNQTCNTPQDNLNQPQTKQRPAQTNPKPTFNKTQTNHKLTKVNPQQSPSKPKSNHKMHFKPSAKSTQKS